MHTSKNFLLNTFDLSAEFSASVRADSLLKVSRAIKLSPALLVQEFKQVTDGA